MRTVYETEADYGPERASWLMHHLTDRMCDGGFLRDHGCA